jgi:hypothetical protein
MKRLCRKGVLTPNRITGRLLFEISQLNDLLKDTREHPGYALFRKNGKIANQR